STLAYTHTCRVRGKILVSLLRGGCLDMILNRTSETQSLSSPACGFQLYAWGSRNSDNSKGWSNIRRKGTPIAFDRAYMLTMPLKRSVNPLVFRRLSITEISIGCLPDLLK